MSWFKTIVGNKSVQATLVVLAIFGGFLGATYVTGSLFTPPDIVIPGDQVDVDPPRPHESIQKLTPDVLYIIDSNVECLLLSSPPGMLTFGSDHGPMYIRGRFIDNSKISTRLFKGKYLYSVTGAVAGRCELFVIPTNIKRLSDIQRRTLDVEGVAPGPDPPGPQPPNPPGPVTTGKLSVVFVMETMDLSKLSPKQAAIRSSTILRDYLKSHCATSVGTPEFRFVDPNSDLSGEPEKIKKLAAQKTDILPRIVIENDKGSSYADKLPASVDECLTILKKYGG